MTKLRVTVATGQCVVLDPHPSGFPGLGPLILEAGDTLFAEPAEAERLFQNGQVLSLDTGKPIQRRPDPMAGRVTVQYGGGPVQDASSAFMSYPSWAALAEPANPEPPRATLRTFGQAPMPGSLATIENADGTLGLGF